jgi:hypothetical protein
MANHKILVIGRRAKALCLKVMRGLSNGVKDWRELRVNGFGQMADPSTLMSRYPPPAAFEYAGPNQPSA